MKRIDAISEFVRSPFYGSDRSLIVSNLGYCSRELYSLSDKPNNFYMLGSMGLASSIGLGISLSQRNKEIFVIEGDGSLLMNLGSLATIANSAPGNFHLLVMDNHSHGSTGGQPTHTAMGTDLLKIAKGAGIRDAIRITTRAKLRRTLHEKKTPSFLLIECAEGNADVPIIPLGEIEIKERFMRSAATNASDL